MPKKNQKVRIYTIGATLFATGAGLGYFMAWLTGIQSSATPLLSALIGLIVAFSTPLWQAFFVNAPNLSVEINSIKRTVSDTATISIDETPEFRPLRTEDTSPFFLDGFGIPTRSTARQKKKGLTLEETEDLLSNAKQRLRDLPSQIEERKKDLDRVNALTPENTTEYELNRLNRPLSPEVNITLEELATTISNFRAAYKKRFEDLEKTFSDLQSSLPVAERKLEQLRKDLVDNRSFFTISASLVNSGKSNSAVKVPALLRVSIGEGNYIDLKLTLNDFENKSEISAHGTRIVTFHSPEVSSLPEEDRKLINTYWGQSVSSRLLTEDIHGKIYLSNTIAFAEGLYQKIIYDRLARAATEN